MQVLNGDGSKKEPWNPALVALLGTALGIVGSLATTAVSAHYTTNDHAVDRAEAARKERRERLTMVYTSAFNVLKAYQQQKIGPFRIGVPSNDDLVRLMREASTEIQLNCRAGAYKTFQDVMAKTNDVAARNGSMGETDPELEQFIASARADIEERPAPAPGATSQP